MFRKMMMLTSALAFIVPLALSQPSAARPLATPVQPAEWCWGDCGDDGGDEDVDFDIDIDLKLCVEIKFDRADLAACEVVRGPECLARCTPEAVAESCAMELGARAGARSLAACGAARLDVCRDQCGSGGAGFCERGGDHPPGIGKGHCMHKDKPGVIGHQHDGDYDKKCDMKKPDKDKEDKDNEENDVVFVDIDACFFLDVDIESKDH